MGALVAFGIIKGSADAQVRRPEVETRRPARVERTDAELFHSIMEDAFATGDMRRTLPKYEDKLTPTQKRALERLTPRDLQQLKAIKDKLGPNIGNEAVKDTGVILW